MPTPSGETDSERRVFAHSRVRISQSVADGLVQPWSIAFLPGGDALVTERPGRLRILRNGALLPTPVEGVPEVFYQGQGGLLEIAVHPRFAENRLVYLTYALLRPERF